MPALRSNTLEGVGVAAPGVIRGPGPALGAGSVRARGPFRPDGSAQTIPPNSAKTAFMATYSPMSVPAAPPSDRAG